MFQLTPAELDNAYEAVRHHGYSALWPTPHEWATVEDNWPFVQKYLTELDLDVYKPYKPFASMRRRAGRTSGSRISCTQKISYSIRLSC